METKPNTSRQLHPGWQEMLNAAQASNEPQYWELSPTEVRKLAKEHTEYASINTKPLPLYSVENLKIPGVEGKIPVRIYTPRELDKDAPFPILVFFHGGGWVLGDLDSHDVPCRHLCKQADCTEEQSCLRATNR